MILITTLLPSSSMPSTLSIWDFLSFDAFAHAFMFAILNFFMIVGLKKQFTYPKLKYYAIRTSFFISSMFGIFIELLQHFLVYGRQGDLVDIICNTTGCLIGIALFKWIY